MQVIFDWIQKMMFMSVGFIFGVVFGIILISSGLFKIMESEILKIPFIIFSIAGFISLFILLRNDKKIEVRKDYE